VKLALVKQARTFLVLVPHRDTRLVLRRYSETLFRAGFTGAYHFPWVSPLAVISRPFNTEELKHCARVIREAAGGKIQAQEASATVFPAGEDGALLFGPRLDLSIPKDALCGSESKITSVFSPSVIGSCLLSEGEISELPSPPRLSFRAAAAANMLWLPLRSGGKIIGYKWKIGKLIWLAPTHGN